MVRYCTLLVLSHRPSFSQLRLYVVRSNALIETPSKDWPSRAHCREAGHRTSPTSLHLWDTFRILVGAQHKNFPLLKLLNSIAKKGSDSLSQGNKSNCFPALITIPKVRTCQMLMPVQASHPSLSARGFLSHTHVRTEKIMILSDCEGFTAGTVGDIR